MRTLVVIPTYQEAQNIRRVLDSVLACAPGADVLVVDDGSPDGTGALVADHPSYARRVFLLTRTAKQGLGSAYRAGFEWTHGRDYTAVVEMDADLSHPAEAVPALVAALASGADLAIGSRYVSGGTPVGWSWKRRLISRAGNVYVRLVLWMPVRDATAGFRAFRATVLRAIDVATTRSDGYAFQIETTWLVYKAGLAIVEVPITFTERTAGSSKMNAAIAREAVVGVARWRVGKRAVRLSA